MIDRERKIRPELSYSIDQELAAQERLGEWARNHSNELVTELAYDPESRPYQRLDVIHLEPKPNLEIARQIGEMGLGKESYNELIANLQKHDLIGEIRYRALSGKSTLMATAHFRNIIDTPASHNAAFVASGDESFAYKNVILANHMVKRLQIMGIGVPEIIQQSGHLVFGHPTGEAAAMYGMDEDVTQSGNRALAPIFTSLLENGVLFHTALSETRAKNIILADGTPAKMLPRAKEALAALTRKRMPLAVGVPIDLNPGAAKSDVMTMQIEDVSDVHSLMEQMAKALSTMSGEIVIYGLPEGAKLA